MKLTVAILVYVATVFIGATSIKHICETPIFLERLPFLFMLLASVLQLQLCLEVFRPRTPQLKPIKVKTDD